MINKGVLYEKVDDENNSKDAYYVSEKMAFINSHLINTACLHKETFDHIRIIVEEKRHSSLCCGTFVK